TAAGGRPRPGASGPRLHPGGPRGGSPPLRARRGGGRHAGGARRVLPARPGRRPLPRAAARGRPPPRLAVLRGVAGPLRDQRLLPRRPRAAGHGAAPPRGDAPARALRWRHDRVRGPVQGRAREPPPRLGEWTLALYV